MFKKKEKKNKQKKQLKYSPKGVCSELAMVDWPHFSSLMLNSFVVILFVLIFAGFFIGCESLVGLAFKTWL